MKTIDPSPSARTGDGDRLIRGLLELRSSPGVWLLAYYLIVAGVLVAVSVRNPWFGDFLFRAGEAAANVPDLEGAFQGSVRLMQPESSLGTLGVAFIALFSALVFAAPVVWIYMVVMRQDGYDRPFVRMLTMLPIVVAGVVRVVRGDLALAFALAGIVAAVRFRTTVKDLENAVFAFAAIGIGLAAGTGNLLLAGTLSVCIAYLAFLQWRLGVGSVQPSLELGHSNMPLSEALVPGETHRPVVIGWDDAAHPVHAADLEPLSTSIDRFADYVAADSMRRSKKYDTLLLAYTDAPDEAEDLMSSVLEEQSKRWVLVDRIARSRPGAVALAYLARLKKSVDVGELVHRLDCGPDSLIKAVELKPIKGLRRKLT